MSIQKLSGSLVFLVLFQTLCLFSQTKSVQQKGGALALEKIPNVKPRNIVFILTDDHRFDALSFLDTNSFVQTPNLDELAKDGAYMPNAFVTTSLCSPSRASILTGLYAHKHKVIDNQHPVSEDLVFYPQYLQEAGYQTAMIGKWHIGGNFDDPQRGFDYWVSFKGQGSYYPNKNGLNVNGKHVAQKGYITDELTDYALEFLQSREKSRPFMLYLSHKGVHSNFLPANRHKDMFKGEEFIPPLTIDSTNHKGAPMWVQNQRNSWHGVDFPYHSNLDIEEYYQRYMETLYGVDENVGRIVDYLKQNGLYDSTLIVYMGDNGFQFGEHGLIDKRTAYEASMKVPMIAHCPDIIKPETRVEEVVANIDIAPTFLEAAGLEPPAYMDGKSFIPLLKENELAWRENLLYEYYWERNFPQTPTIHALRGNRYKYIHYYGIWDSDELYDLKNDPLETENLINQRKLNDTLKSLNNKMFEILEKTGGMYIPLYPDSGRQHNLRNGDRSPSAKFPKYLLMDNLEENNN
jgi:N-acetylglucosamine-6-sulfatase